MKKLNKFQLLLQALLLITYHLSHGGNCAFWAFSTVCLFICVVIATNLKQPANMLFPSNFETTPGVVAATAHLLHGRVGRLLSQNEPGHCSLLHAFTFWPNWRWIFRGAQGFSLKGFHLATRWMRPYLIQTKPSLLLIRTFPGLKYMLTLLAVSNLA